MDNCAAEAGNEGCSLAVLKGWIVHSVEEPY